MSGRTARVCRRGPGRRCWRWSLIVLGSTGGLCDALEGTRERRGGHEPGRVFCDLAVMLADGGRCVSDLAALAGQESLFGEVASVSTARRVMLSIGEVELAGIRAAQGGRLARGRGRRDAAPERVILDFDATPIDVHSEKEQAAGHYKGGFGFNPLLVTCGREVLAGILRPGNAGANNADDHLALLGLGARAAARTARWTGRSSRGLTRPAPATISPTPAARPGSVSRSAIRSPSPSAKRCWALRNRRGGRRSIRTASRATGRG